MAKKKNIQNIHMLKAKGFPYLKIQTFCQNMRRVCFCIIIEIILPLPTKLRPVLTDSEYGDTIEIYNNVWKLIS